MDPWRPLCFCFAMPTKVPFEAVSQYIILLVAGTIMNSPGTVQVAFDMSVPIKASPSLVHQSGNETDKSPPLAREGTLEWYGQTRAFDSLSKRAKPLSGLNMHLAGPKSMDLESQTGNDHVGYELTRN